MRKIFTSIFVLVLGISLAFGQLAGSQANRIKVGTLNNTSSGSNKIDVWDFGATQLDTAIYKNNLDSATINSWYATSIVPGSASNVLPSFTAGLLQWVGGTNDRLRTTNTGLTRYDQNIASVTGYTGRLYVNAGAATGRYLSLTLNEDDEVTIVEKTDAGGKIMFQYVADPLTQTDSAVVTLNLDTLSFVAKAAGIYHIFDKVGKPSYFRIYRKDASYATINGTVDITNAPGIPAGYGISLTNNAGKTWNSVMTSETFTIMVPVGYTYSLSLTDANGYIITNGKTLAVTEATTTYNVELLKVDLFHLSGAITGLNTTQLQKLTLVYTPDATAHKIYVPEPVVDAVAGTYSVMLEADCEYTISALGLNNYYIPSNTITIGTADATAELAFAPKPVYNVTINTTGLTAEQLAVLSLTFTNLNEPGYSYSFDPGAGITLRDGTYSIAYSGLDDFPVQMGLTSNLTVDGADVSKTLAFNPVTIWSFDDKAVVSGATSYKGLLFTGNVVSELAKGHLTAKPGATIRVPLNVGEKMKITYYYSAAFSINSGDTTTSASGSTSVFESVEHIYTGTETGYDTIKVVVGASTTYITEISIAKTVDYSPVIYVGTDKEYKTVNEALSAIAQMSRGGTDRVTVMIDPGNYEEMLVVTSANVTLKNAATTPDIALANKGVDISANAVRITSYYGTGYSYYSMGNNQKWNAEILRVNKENGYLSYTNAGAGTTNGSYWNATAVISANGFEAEDIIFENSFNQYISKKESDDVVVMWEVGNKGLRPTDIGNTSVQNRSFVERAAAIAITNNTDKVILTNCRVVGRQDAFYGGTGTRVAVNKGAVMGAVDYIFGGMTAVFYKTDLVMNTSDESVDAAYLTAAQQSSGRGYLMYKCTVKSATPGTETTSVFHAKPGYFGRPWQATTSEVVFYNTTVYTSDFTGFEGKSLISPVGWSNSLGGESNLMYEYGTFEFSGEDNLASRVAWCTLLTVPTLKDGTEISTFNFTKGTDNWDPLHLEEDVFTVSTNALTISSSDNSTNTFDITANVSWKVSSDQAWLSVSSDYGTDNATITLTTMGNETLVERSAIVTVSGNGVSPQTITVTQDAGVTGIKEKGEKNLKIFPNPVKSILTLNNTNHDAIVSIYDVCGNLLINETAKEKIDVSNLTKGVYFIKVTDQKTTKTNKFVKQ